MVYREGAAERIGMNKVMAALQPTITAFADIVGISPTEAADHIHRLVSEIRKETGLATTDADSPRKAITPATEFNRIVADAIVEFGNLTDTEPKFRRVRLAEMATEYAGRVITPGQLKNWSRRAQPRDAGTARIVVRALMQVLAAHRGVAAPERPIWVAGVSTQQEINRWLEKGMSEQQIRLAGQMTLAKFHAWKSGALVKVRRVTFEAFQERVALRYAELEKSLAFERATPEEVQAALTLWVEQGWSLARARIAAQLSPKTFSTWTSGGPVSRPELLSALARVAAATPKTEAPHE